MRSAAYLLLLVVIAGCTSSAPTVSNSPSPSFISSPTAQPTPAALTNRQLAAMYRNAATPINDFVCQFTSAHPETTWERKVVERFASRYMDQLAALSRRLRRIDWNRQTRHDARTLLSRLADAEVAYRRVVYTVDDAKSLEAWNQTDRFDDRVAAAATLLLGDLGQKRRKSC